MQLSVCKQPAGLGPECAGQCEAVSSCLLAAVPRFPGWGRIDSSLIKSERAHCSGARATAAVYSLPYALFNGPGAPRKKGGSFREPLALVLFC